MTLRVLGQPLALDPLIAEARRRARQRRFVVVVSGLAVLGAAAALALELPSPGGGTPGKLADARSAGTLAVPKGADGIAVVVYGRLSVTTKTGFHIHGLPVSAATLAPGARFVAAGIGHALTELAPSGKRLWSVPVGEPVADCGACGVVEKIAWSPDGLRIAYLVRTRAAKAILHVVWRDGTHDSVIARNAGGEQPSWRSDSRAVAYIGARGKPTVVDLVNRSLHVITWPIARSPATQLAFAPRGSDLAIGTETAALLVGARHRVVFDGQTQAVYWLGNRLAVSERIAPSGRSKTQLYTVGPSRAKLMRTIHLPGPIMAAHGRVIAVPAGAGVLAGPIASLHRVFRFVPERWPANSLCYCGPLPFGAHAVSMG